MTVADNEIKLIVAATAAISAVAVAVLSAFPASSRNGIDGVSCMARRSGLRFRGAKWSTA